MSVGKRLFVAAAILICLGASAAYYVVFLFLTSPESPYRHLLPWLGAALVLAASTLLAMEVWRRYARAVKQLKHQLRTLAANNAIGLLMLDEQAELGQLVEAINEYLCKLRQRLDHLYVSQREMRIQMRVAETEKKHTEAIIQSISDAVIVANQYNELVLANEAAGKLLGFSVQLARHRPLESFISDKKILQLMRQGRQTTRDEPYVVEHTIVGTGGKQRVVKVKISKVLDKRGELRAIVAVMHDVTREKKISQMKSEFISDVSHELRTPLTSIQAYVEMLLEDSPDPEQQRRFCQIIHSQTLRMRRLIDNILDISLIESGVMKVNKQHLQLAPLAAEAVELMRPQAQAKGIQMEYQADDDRLDVYADRDMIQRAIINLISNAIKYTPRGGKIQIHLAEGEGSAMLSVIDNGCGIDQGQLDRIFEKFFRVPHRGEADSEGSGLGLNLVKQIVEGVHHGRIFVRSEPGRGSRFTIRLPLVSTHQPQKEVLSDAAPRR